MSIGKLVLFLAALAGLCLSKELDETILRKLLERERTIPVKRVFDLRGRIRRSDGDLRKYDTRSETGKNITFYSKIFDGSYQDFYWNIKDTEKVVVLAGNTPFLSEDGGKSFADISSKLTNFNTIYPFYGPHGGGFGVRSMEKSVWQPNYIIFTGKGTAIWSTRDGGLTFTEINVDRYFLKIEHHPRLEGTLIATFANSSCFDDNNANDGNCNMQLFISRNHAAKWQLIADYVYSYSWGKKGDDIAYDEVIYYTQAKRRSGQQFTYEPTSQSIKFIEKESIVYAYTLRISSSDMIYDKGRLLIVNDLLIYVEANDGAVKVSHGGSKFRDTNFNGYDLRGYSFIGFSDSTVSVVDSPRIEDGANTGFSNYQGDLWFSEFTGTYFVRSLQKVPLISLGNGKFSFDIHRIKSLEGTYIANSVGQHGKLRSRISWNNGASWSLVQTLEGQEGTIDENQNPFVLYGTVFSEISDSSEVIYSDSNAAGLIVAIGKHNVNIVDFVSGKVEEGDVYFSRNGGRTFYKILTGNHHCVIVNQGSIIVCTELEHTNMVKFSYDSGKTWKSEKFTNNLVNVNKIHTHPDSSKLSLIIESYDQSELTYTQFNLAQLNLPQCTENQYETWYGTNQDSTQTCILGHKTTYRRPAKESACFSNLDNLIVKIENCPCGSFDYGCNFNYFYNYSSNICVPEPNSPPEIIVCVDGKYLRDQHMRKVPGNTCDKNLPGSVDFESKILTDCPDITIDYIQRTKVLAIALGLGLTLAFLVIAGAIVFVVWSRRKGYLHYRPVQTQDMAIGTDDPTPFDFQDNN